MSILEVFKKKDDKKSQQTVKADNTSISNKKDNDKIAKTSAKKKTASAKTISSSISKGQAHKILVKPLITEKATELGVLNKYCFDVSTRSNKIEIKKAVEVLYGVSPVDVKILNKMGKEVRRGRVIGKTKSTKKAIVTLKEGDKIEVFAGV